MRRKKLLFLVAHRPGRSPGQRFRFEQYLDYLSSNGFDYHISYLISKEEDQVFYSPRQYFAKFRLLIRSLRKRFNDLKQCREFDAVFIYREAHMLGITWFERQLRRKGMKLILDFDDSIWLNDVSDGNRNISFLKRPSKTSRLISLSNMVLVGNQFLADYAMRFNENVNIVPTTIDTGYYTPGKHNDKWPVCIGWTGSSTTLKHLLLAVPLLRRLRDKYGEKICFKVISDEILNEDVPGLENVIWKKESEIADLQSIDIGIMPLPDDDWARGKCGFKGLQYMALEIPAVLSAVGVNKQIIEDGVNGFLAENWQQWYEKICLLVDSFELRRELGCNGRRTVEQYYSYNSQKDRYLGFFNQLTSS